ncbi:MAG TPA: response regulator [Candidatus Limnocylindrales bacterium]|nr:response regulator [Candidatus Limnocylindrales bacterium]
MSVILILDAEPLVRQTITRILDQAGFTVLAAGDVAEALRLVQSSRPDLLLTNVYVPQSSGREAASLLKKLCPGMRTLMVAGLPDEEPIMTGIAASEVMDFFPKPFTAAELTAKVRQLLDDVHDGTGR